MKKAGGLKERTKWWNPLAPRVKHEKEQTGFEEAAIGLSGSLRKKNKSFNHKN